MTAAAAIDFAAIDISMNGIRDHVLPELPAVEYVV
jgi:hypothetical protein